MTDTLLLYGNSVHENKNDFFFLAFQILCNVCIYTAKSFGL